MSDLDAQACQVCAGLTLHESWLLAACLQQPRALTHLQGEGGAALQAAAARAPRRQRQELGQRIQARLAQSGGAGLALLHPGWLQRLQGQERPAALQLAQQEEAPPRLAQRRAATWLRRHLEQVAVPMDPRHLQGLLRGPWLELELLRLTSPQEQGALLLHLGAVVLSWSTAAASRRERAAIQSRLPQTAQRTYATWQDQRDPSLTRLLAAQTRRAAHHPERGLAQVGLALLGVAGAHRHRHALLGLARAMDPAWGLDLERALDASAPTRPATARQAAATALRLVQGLARQGLLEAHWAQRRPCLEPPTEEA